MVLGVYERWMRAEWKGALAAWIMTETMLTQEIQIHVAMGTNRAVLEIGDGDR